jgi:TPR repeat protein
MFSVGGCYYQGLGAEEDWRQAKEWFTKAWTAGNNDALYFLGMIYADEEKSSRAEEFFLQAANDDENYFQEDAQDSLALMYYTGNGVVQDTALAIEWAEKAAEQGNDNSMLLLGDIYMEGVGIAQDMAKAKAWYEKAKAAGNDEAEQRLADLS